jgi:hypothetical protein
MTGMSGPNVGLEHSLLGSSAVSTMLLEGRAELSGRRFQGCGVGLIRSMDEGRGYRTVFVPVMMVEDCANHGVSSSQSPRKI